MTNIELNAYHAVISLSQSAKRIADALEALVKLATDDCAARANGKEADNGANS